MNIKINWLNHDLATTGQISEKDLPQLKKFGFRTIICNRPNFEDGPLQPQQENISMAAEKLDIEFSFLPVESNYQSEIEAKQMSELINKMPKPILAYCRSGGRCMSLIGLSFQLGLVSLNK